MDGSKDDQSLPDQVSLEEHWKREGNIEIVQQLLHQIRHEFQSTTWRAFELYVLKELSAEEVAKLLNMNVTSVYTAKSRVLRRLRQEYYREDF